MPSDAYKGDAYKKTCTHLHKNHSAQIWVRFQNDLVNIDFDKKFIKFDLNVRITQAQFRLSDAYKNITCI